MARLLGGLVGDHMVRVVALKAGVLKECGKRREGIVLLITDTLIMATARVGLAQIADRPCDQVRNHIIRQRLGFFFTAVMCFLLNRILGPLDTPFGAIDREFK